jgi:hypothetical protein
MFGPTQGGESYGAGSYCRAPLPFPLPRGEGLGEGVWTTQESGTKSYVICFSAFSTRSKASFKTSRDVAKLIRM